MLIPLADLLGVSVTELLMCENIIPSNPLEAEQVEDLVKTAITYADADSERAYQINRKWTVFYGVSLCMGGIGIWINDRVGQPCLETLMTVMLLCAVFGAYFCVFVRTKLPAYYDEYEVNMFYDGAFRMHMPGMKFNNSNWTHVVQIVRICMCLIMILFPVINFVMGSIMRNIWIATRRYCSLLLFLCSFFIPVYLVGKKCNKCMDK